MPVVGAIRIVAAGSGRIIPGTLGHGVGSRIQGLHQARRAVAFAGHVRGLPLALVQPSACRTRGLLCRYAPRDPDAGEIIAAIEDLL